MDLCGYTKIFPRCFTRRFIWRGLYMTSCSLLTALMKPKIRCPSIKAAIIQKNLELHVTESYQHSITQCCLEWWRCKSSKSFLGHIQFVSTKMATTLKSTTLFAYLVHILRINWLAINHCWIIEYGNSVDGSLQASVERDMSYIRSIHEVRSSMPWSTGAYKVLVDQTQSCSSQMSAR